MSMRTMAYTGWFMVVIGAVMAVGGVAVGGPALAGLLLGGLGCAGGGAFMVWLGAGWDKPMESSDELYKYGRPANAEVLSVEPGAPGAGGTRTAKLELKVSPVNESSFKTTRTVAIPASLQLAAGQTVTVKFDPQSRKNFVLMEENFQVKDQVTASAETFFGGLQGSQK
jgi:hypothetical protein